MTKHDPILAQDDTLRPAGLSIRGLTIAYGADSNSNVIIRDLNLTIAKGEIVGLIGDTAAGKSTLALGIMGMTRSPGRIVGGQVLVDGVDLLSLSSDEQRRIRGRDLAIIVQNPRSALNPVLKIGDQIGYAVEAHDPDFAPARRRGSDYRQKLKARVIALLVQVGINDPERRMNAFVHELSGGMAQRALIAMALAARPKYLIADEPTSGLDVTIQAQFLDQLWHAVKKEGTSVLLIAKELGVIANYCDRVAVLHEGRVADEQEVTDFFANPRHEYSRAILGLSQSGPRVKYLSNESQEQPVIETRSLVKHFPVRNSAKVVQAVNDVTLSIKKGETLGLVGESGSGKSTVGRCLLNLITPTDGRVIFNTRDLSEMSAQQMRSTRAKLQIVLQDPVDSFNPVQSVLQALEEPLLLHENLTAGQRRARVIEMLTLVGLDEKLLDQRPHGLGVGSMQRLAIARALVTNPEFIVLDEPTSVLSPRAIVELIELLDRIQRELGTSFLFISHDLSTVRHLCQRIAVMYLGEVVEEGSVEQLFTDPRHPYSRALLSAHLGHDPHKRRVDREITGELKGEIPSPIDLPAGCHLMSRCPHVSERCKAEKQQLYRLPDQRKVRCWKVQENVIL